MKKPAEKPGFDSYATGYDEALMQGLAASGEDKTFFARGRVAWLAGCLRRRAERPRRALDFGCGTGTAAPFLRELLDVETIVGVDVSVQSLEAAQRLHSSTGARFVTFERYAPCEEMDLVFCNGVFHHIRPAERAAAVRYVFRSLRPGGLFAFWENNPWNPGARYVMKRIPFDRDAIPLSATEAKRLLQDGGFEVLERSFLFIFPRLLKWLRPLEAPLSRWPVGAQYQLLCRKPRQ